MSDLIRRLRELSAHEHSDLAIGDEAADRIAELENTNEKLRNCLSQKDGEVHRAYSRIGELKAKFNRMEPVLREEVRDELFGDGVDMIFDESGPAKAYRLGRDNALNCLMHILGSEGSGGANNE